MEDYGTILVHFLHGLTYDQKYILVQQNVENQVFTRNRNHYIQILNQCTEMMKLAKDDEPLKINWILPDYKYTFRIDTI